MSCAIALRTVLKINEIFFSIQGESSYAGFPTVFVRTSGCHLRCTYCDTTYAYHDGKKMSLAEVIEIIQKYPAKHVCVTGGEPLLQKAAFELMSQLCDLGYHVSIETSGDLPCTEIDSRVHKVIDIKTPDSGEPGRFDLNNLKLDGPKTEYKFVICSEADFVWAENFCKTHNISQNTNIFYSPSHGQIQPIWLAGEILKAGSNARLQLQLHKYIWSESQRGV